MSKLYWQESDQRSALVFRRKLEEEEKIDRYPFDLIFSNLLPMIVPIMFLFLGAGIEIYKKVTSIYSLQNTFWELLLAYGVLLGTLPIGMVIFGHKYLVVTNRDHLQEIRHSKIKDHRIPITTYPSFSLYMALMIPVVIIAQAWTFFSDHNFYYVFILYGLLMSFIVLDLWLVMRFNKGDHSIEKEKVDDSKIYDGIIKTRNHHFYKVS